MFLERGDFPYSLYELLVDGYMVVGTGVSHRPDRIVADAYGGSLATEMMCNRASNVSPLSAVEGVEYLLPSREFMRHFGG